MNAASEADYGQTKRKRPNMHQLFIENKTTKQSQRTTLRVEEMKQRKTMYPLYMIRPFQKDVTAAMETGKIRR